MALFLTSPPSFQNLVKPISLNHTKLSPRSSSRNVGFGVKACFFNPAEDPLVKEALKEPVAFLGGVFAGLLRLDLKEDPLREWVTRTVEASGITKDEETVENGSSNSGEEESPQQIQIE